MPPAASEHPTSARLRLRTDLELSHQRHRGRPVCVVKDPLTLRYYRFRDEEYTLLELLRVGATVDGLRDAFERKYAPRRTDAGRIQAFLAWLHQADLLLADSPGQGSTLLRRRTAVEWRRLFARWTNPLAIRLFGVDPRPVIDRLYPLVRWAFTPICVIACLLVALCAALLVTVQFATFSQALPTFRDFFCGPNIVWLAAVLAVTKVLHELGHALVCKHHGGECHEIGVMLFCFMPSLYCDVSDAWMLPSRWSRMATAAAGMYVEIVLASWCTLLWWFSEPGLLNQLCLDVMFVCSVGTVLVNANPLMRFDGYYILSDWLETPNLGPRAEAAIRQQLSCWLFGTRPGSDPFLAPRDRNWLMAYGVAAFVYRWTILIAVFWFLNGFFAEYGLAPVGRMLTVLVLVGMLANPLVGGIRRLRRPRGGDEGRRWRSIASLAAAALLVTAGALVPLPTYVIAPLVIEPAGAEHVYVEMPGRLQRLFVAPGDAVHKGDLLARLVNSEQDAEVARMTGQRDRQRLHIANLERRRIRDATAGDQLPAARASLAELEGTLDERQAVQRRMQLLASADGTVLAPAWRGPVAKADRLARWTGTPFDERNRDAYLETGTHFCSIGDPARVRALVAIAAHDVPLVQAGQAVEMTLDGLPLRSLAGHVSEVARVDLRWTPPELSAKTGGEIPTYSDQQGVERPIESAYQARVAFDGAVPEAVPGFRGRAKIRVADRTIAQRAASYLARTFRFDL